MRFASFIFVSTLVFAGCGDDTTGDTDSGSGTDSGVGIDSGTGGTDAGFDAGGGDDAATGTDGSTGTDGAVGAGACTNADDAAFLMTIDVAMEATTCGTRCFGGGPCVTMCMETVGLSSGCATCFGDTAMCTRDMCLRPCLGGDSPECTTCRRDMGCFASFEACSGLSGS